MNRPTQHANLARPADKRNTKEKVDPVRRRHLVDSGQWLAGHWSMPLRRSRVRQLVDQYLAEGGLGGELDFKLWLKNDYGFTDQTGVIAARNVDRQRGGGRNG